MHACVCAYVNKHVPLPVLSLMCSPATKVHKNFSLVNTSLHRISRTVSLSSNKTALNNCSTTLFKKTLKKLKKQKMAIGMKENARVKRYKTNLS